MTKGVFFDVEIDSLFFRYYIKNEIKFRLKSSPLLWCYYGCIFIILVPSLLSFIFSYSLFLNYSEVFNPFLFFFLLFFPVSLNIFSREKQHSMLDYLVMSSTRFKSIFLSRIFANAFLLIFPLVISFTGMFLIQYSFRNEYSSIFLPPIFVILAILFFLCWYLLAILVLLISELRFPSSIIRVIFYYGTILLFFIVLSLFYMFDISRDIVHIAIGSDLFTNLLFSLFLLITSCMIFLFLISDVLNKLIKFITTDVTTNGQFSTLTTRFSGIEFHYPFKAFTTNQFKIWRYSLYLLNILPYFLLFIALPEHSVSVERILAFFCYHFVCILLLVFLTIFPRVAAEKEYNMEEMILSRISVYRYYYVKVSMLLKPIFLNLLISVFAIMIFFQPDRSLFSLVVTNLFFRSLYFVTILILVWRLFPAKDLLQSIFLSIFGMEVVGFLVSSFLFPGVEFLQIIFSPIISSVLISACLTDPEALEILNLFLQVNVFLSFCFFMASLALLKSEIRYE